LYYGRVGRIGHQPFPEIDQGRVAVAGIVDVIRSQPAGRTDVLLAEFGGIAGAEFVQA
jgi:hypothetical protein